MPRPLGPRLRQALQELCAGTGQMARLGSEGGALKLDWVEGVRRLLDDPSGLEGIEAEARAIADRGIRHVIWSGMGGSVMTVRVLDEMGLFEGSDLAIYPLDSTDPAALNRIARRIAGPRDLPPAAGDRGALRDFLGDVMMIGVAMGMTSEEPISHLTWFAGLLEAAGLRAGDHMLVMALPGSYLDRFARERDVPARPLQLDSGTGTGGRMSSPTTRVFLLPAAIAASGDPGSLRSVLSRAWDMHDLAGATAGPHYHPYVRLAAALAGAAEDGVARMYLMLPGDWSPLLPWVEQLMEESLGKGGKGVLVFGDQEPSANAPCFRSSGSLQVVAGTAPDNSAGFILPQPALAGSLGDQLTLVAAAFLGWQLTMAVYGALENIHFAGQPAVESYKARARELREQGDPLEDAEPLAVLTPDTSPAEARDAAERIAAALRTPRCPLYFDVTVNGEVPERWVPDLWRRVCAIGNRALGVPVKLRRAPAAYHSTEQSEMDGPLGVVSLRVLLRQHERALLGVYDDRFLVAQAVATQQAMVQAGRACFLLVLDGDEEAAWPLLFSFLERVEV